MVKLDISTVASHVAIPLNGFLIWLIREKSGKNLESYRKILYLGAIFDLVFSINIILTSNFLVFTSDLYFIVIEGWSSILGRPWDYILPIIYVYQSYASMSFTTVQFIYRFFLICCDVTLGRKSFCVLIGLALLFPSNFLYWFLLFYPKPNELETYGPLLLQSGMAKEEHLKSFIVASRVKISQSSKIYSEIIAIGSFGIIIFCSIGIIYKLWRHQKKFAKADRKIQNQITIVLTCEAMVPLLTMVIPLQFLAMFNRTFTWIPSIIGYIIAFSPLFNPIIKMFVISPFRKTIFKPFFTNKKSTSLVVTINSSTNK